MATFLRRGKDLGISKTMEWLSEWYGELDDVHVSQFTIPIEHNSGKLIRDDPNFKNAETGKQTPLHVFLKYQAYNWLINEKLHKSPRFEVKMYLMPEELLDLMKEHNLNIRYEHFDIRKSQILPKYKPGTPPPVLNYGETIIVDIYSKNTSIEVGFTSPYNLFMPLLENLVEYVIWIPYPAKSSPNSFIIEDHGLKEVNAYMINLLPS